MFASDSSTPTFASDSSFPQTNDQADDDQGRQSRTSSHCIFGLVSMLLEDATEKDKKERGISSTLQATSS